MEVDGRRDYRHGGGHGGGGRQFNKRKRGRDDDDFDHQPHRNQRRRAELPPPGTRIRRGLLEIGEGEAFALQMPHEIAMNLARLITDNIEDEYVRDTFSTVVMKLVVEQPLKIPLVTGVVLFAYAEKAESIQDVVNKAGEQLQECFDKGQWREVKLMLRFLACLSQVFEEDGILPILDELFNRAADLQTASLEDCVGIELVKIILLTIPYLLASTSDQSLRQKAAEVLEKTDIVASTRHELEPLVEPCLEKGDEREKPMIHPSTISILQRQLQDEAAKNWPLACILRVYDPSYKSRVGASAQSNGDSNGETSSKLTFPSITVPSPINSGPNALFPELFFSMFADREVESVPPTSNIASTLMRDVCVDTINILDYNRSAVAKFLYSLDNFWPQNLFAPRKTLFDTLRTFELGQPTWKPEDVAVDAVFSQLLMLPSPEHKLVYYHSIITELCMFDSGAIAPTLGRVIRPLYRNMDILDLELGFRFTDWLAQQLSNFEYRWKWVEWIDDLALPNLDPKKAFLIALVNKEIRLSFLNRIRETTPEAYHFLIPEPTKEEIPDFKFNDEGTPFAAQGQKIREMIKERAPAADIDQVFDIVTLQAAEHGISDPLLTITDIYMTSILHVGAKSLSHVLLTIDRSKDRLVAMGQQNTAVQSQIITSVMAFWKEFPGTAVKIVDKLLNYTIITPMSIITWALTDNIDRGRTLASSQIYELVDTTMIKVKNRVHQLLSARNDRKVSYAQRQEVDKMLPNERERMRELFAAIGDAVAGVATGAQDGMIERYDDGEGEMETVKSWGTKWARAWGRKAAVEETISGEAAVGPLLPDEVVPDDMVAETTAQVEAEMDQVS